MAASEGLFGGLSEIFSIPRSIAEAKGRSSPVVHDAGTWRSLEDANDA
jgi:hypothetical protein